MISKQNTTHTPSPTCMTRPPSWSGDPQGLLLLCLLLEAATIEGNKLTYSLPVCQVQSQTCCSCSKPSSWGNPERHWCSKWEWVDIESKLYHHDFSSKKIQMYYKTFSKMWVDQACGEPFGRSLADIFSVILDIKEKSHNWRRAKG